MRGAYRQARLAVIHPIEIDKFAKSLFERLSGVISSPVAAKRIFGAGMGEGSGSEETGDSIRHRRPVRQLFVEAGKRRREAPDRALLHPFPEFAQSRQTIFGRVLSDHTCILAGDETVIDGTDRRSDNPVRLNSSLMQRLVNARAVVAHVAATWRHQNDLR